MRQVQAIIFDMDGVIVDSEPCHERAFHDVVREIGYGEKLDLRFADYIGRSDQVLWADFVARHNPAQTVEELLAMKRGRVVEAIRRDQPLFDGLPELVEKVAARYALALASGSERPVVEEVLRLKGLGRFFSAVVSDRRSHAASRRPISSSARRSCSRWRPKVAASSRTPNPEWLRVSPPACK